MLALIVAVSKNGVVGKDGKIPWHIPEDLKYFKKVTEGSIVVMGKNTFKSLNYNPLKNRDNIVVSNTLPWPEGDSYSIVRNIYTAKGIGQALFQNCFFIGGQRIYEEALDFVDKLYITRVDLVVEGGDTFFPDVDGSIWELESSSKEGICDYQIWKRI